MLNKIRCPHCLYEMEVFNTDAIVCEGCKHVISSYHVVKELNSRDATKILSSTNSDEGWYESNT